MKLRIGLLILVIILTLTVVQYGVTAKLTQASGVQALAVTPTTEASMGEGEHEHAKEVTMATVMTTGSQEQIFQVTVTTYLMDTAGFHAMDERINQEGTIEAGDAGVVNRVNGLLAATNWPEELHAQVDPLRETLTQYAEALANDDIEAAKLLATQVHELQHDLSHAATHWAGSMTGSAEHGQADEHSQSEDTEHDHSQ